MANMLTSKNGNIVTNKNDKPIKILGSTVEPGHSFFIPDEKIAEAINDISLNERDNLLHSSVFVIDKGD